MWGTENEGGEGGEKKLDFHIQSKYPLSNLCCFSFPKPKKKKLKMEKKKKKEDLI